MYEKPHKQSHAPKPPAVPPKTSPKPPKQQKGQKPQLADKPLEQRQRQSILQAMLRKSQGNLTEQIAPAGELENALKNSSDTPITRERPWKDDAYHGPKPRYDNPGHHDPSSANFRGGGSRTTKLPDDAEEVYKNAIPSQDGKTWWGRNDQGEIYRYQPHEEGKVHWNGRENSERGLKVPSYIKKRFQSLDIDRSK